LTSRIVRNSVVLVVLAVFGLAVLWTFMSEPGSSDTYTYSELLDDASAGKIESIKQEGTTLTVKLTGVAEERTTTVASPDIN
jgi:hypothetical protein